MVHRISVSILPRAIHSPISSTSSAARGGNAICAAKSGLEVFICFIPFHILEPTRSTVVLFAQSFCDYYSHYPENVHLDFAQNLQSQPSPQLLPKPMPFWGLRRFRQSSVHQHGIGADGVDL